MDTCGKHKGWKIVCSNFRPSTTHQLEIQEKTSSSSYFSQWNKQSLNLCIMLSLVLQLLLSDHGEVHATRSFPEMLEGCLRENQHPGGKVNLKWPRPYTFLENAHLSAHSADRRPFVFVPQAYQCGLGPTVNQNHEYSLPLLLKPWTVWIPYLFPLLSPPARLAFKRELTVQVIYYSGQKQTKKK